MQNANQEEGAGTSQPRPFVFSSGYMIYRKEVFDCLEAESIYDQKRKKNVLLNYHGVREQEESGRHVHGYRVNGLKAGSQRFRNLPKIK